MPRILVVSHSFLERDPRVGRAVAAFRQEGWQVEGLFLDEPQRGHNLRTWRVPIQRRRGSALRYVFEYGLFFLWTLAWIARRVMTRKVDVVYINSPPDFLVFAALPARIRRIPVVLDVHDPMPELLVAKGKSSGLVGRFLERQERSAMRFASSVLTVHEPLRDLLALRSPQVPIRIVMNVPDTAGWPKLQRDPDSRTVVYTGSIALRYGLEPLFRAVASVIDEIPSIRLMLTGEGEDETYLRELADELGIADRMQWTGRVAWEDIVRVQAGAWVGVNAPLPDELGELSFSNKVVEWVAMGLPVIASGTSTMRRYFPEGTLWFVPPGDSEAIAHALVGIDEMDSDAIARRIVASRAALEEIGWPHQRNELLAAVRDAADSPRSS